MNERHLTYELAERLKVSTETNIFSRGTIVCNSWEEFDEAIKDVDCGLVSPGGAGLPRSYIHQLEKDGSIRVFRVIVDGKSFKYYPSHVRFLYPSKDVYVFIPVDDINRIKSMMNRTEVSYA
ncbi:MAG: hypothetical protein ACLQF0_00250 [Dissulfurispiraceae bacterium]